MITSWFIVLGGRGRIVIERQTFSATADQLFLIPPRVWHAFIADEGIDFPLLGVHFDWLPQHDTLAFPLFRPADEPVDEAQFRASRPIPNWDWAASPFLDLKGRPLVRRALESIVAEHARNDEESPMVSAALLAAAASRNARRATENQCPHRRRKRARRAAESEII